MRVETVGFITRVRLPDGRNETTVSMQNHHQKISYDMTFDPKAGFVTIKAIRAPFWTAIVPSTNCAFIHLGKPEVKKKSPRKPPDPVEALPPDPILVPPKRKMRPRPRKEGAPS